MNSIAYQCSLSNIVLLSTLLLYYPHLHTILWGDNLDHVFHGSTLMDLGNNSLMFANASDALLALHRAGYIEPTIFSPSISEAAVLGLSHPVYAKSHIEPPNQGNAFAWDWKVTRELRQGEEL